jgi:uncharacterized protein (TIGR02646 family)
MIRLTSKDIKPLTQNHLDSVQQAILGEPTFAAQVRKAKSKWDNKTSGQTANAAFNDIKETLISMCVGVGICVYCENNEATHIEHIFPKKLYPEKAFLWSNYVLACPTCNTEEKKDKFSVFNPVNSSVDINVTAPSGSYPQPPTDDALFINQRIEDPLDFFELDLINGEYIFTEKFPPGTREYLKAAYTEQLLRLNSRYSLVIARRNAARYFRDRLGKYVKAQSSNDFAELAEAIDDDFGGVNETLAFADEKQRIEEAIKKDILEYPHPTVWKELMRQRANLPRINSFVNQVPEVLTWMP